MAPSMRPFARMFHGVGRDRRWRTKGEYDILLGVKQCRVSFQDSEGVEHSVEVEARTLYEAGLVIDRFRRWEHVQAASTYNTNPKGASRIAMEPREPATQHRIPRKMFDTWLRRPSGSPADTALKKRLKGLLGGVA
jgi:hypothetical protein